MCASPLFFRSRGSGLGARDSGLGTRDSGLGRRGGGETNVLMLKNQHRRFRCWLDGGRTRAENTREPGGTMAPTLAAITLAAIAQFVAGQQPFRPSAKVQFQTPQIIEAPRLSKPPWVV